MVWKPNERTIEGVRDTGEQAELRHNKYIVLHWTNNQTHYEYFGWQHPDGRVQTWFPCNKENNSDIDIDEFMGLLFSAAHAGAIMRVPTGTRPMRATYGQSSNRNVSVGSIGNCNGNVNGNRNGNGSRNGQVHDSGTMMGSQKVAATLSERSGGASSSREFYGGQHVSRDKQTGGIKTGSSSDIDPADFGVNEPRAYANLPGSQWAMQYAVPELQWREICSQLVTLYGQPTSEQLHNAAKAYANHMQENAGREQFTRHMQLSVVSPGSLAGCLPILVAASSIWNATGVHT
eukprot:GDKI01024875.1.p1 GENE.GDKI01024875.1~~GDKI01024875.1.p1  ORF type:complete len:290 (+),score=-8.37 GDKI01024875.1:340-1209(+)